MLENTDSIREHNKFPCFDPLVLPTNRIFHTYAVYSRERSSLLRCINRFSVLCFINYLLYSLLKWQSIHVLTYSNLFNLFHNSYGNISPYNFGRDLLFMPVITKVSIRIYYIISPIGDFMKKGQKG